MKMSESEHEREVIIRSSSRLRLRVAWGRGGGEGATYVPYIHTVYRRIAQYGTASAQARPNQNLLVEMQALWGEPLQEKGGRVDCTRQRCVATCACKLRMRRCGRVAAKDCTS